LSSSNLSSRARGVRAAALALLLAGAQALAQQAEVRMLVQSSPLAGFRYYDAKQVWDDMQVGDALTLVREPHNAYDSNAVRVEWRGRKLGYVPHNENRAVSFHMDRGGAVEARISKLQEHRNPRQRIEFEVLVRL
jgi:hypothetical protein